MTKNAIVDLRDVHQHERVERVCEVVIDIERKKLRVQSKVLPQEYGNCALPAFDFFDETLNTQQIRGRLLGFTISPTRKFAARWRITRRDEFRKW